MVLDIRTSVCEKQQKKISTLPKQIQEDTRGQICTIFSCLRLFSQNIHKETTAKTLKDFKRCLRKFDTDKMDFEPILAIIENRDTGYKLNISNRCYLLILNFKLYICLSILFCCSVTIVCTTPPAMLIFLIVLK